MGGSHVKECRNNEWKQRGIVIGLLIVLMERNNNYTRLHTASYVYIVSCVQTKQTEHKI